MIVAIWRQVDIMYLLIWIHNITSKADLQKNWEKKQNTLPISLQERHTSQRYLNHCDDGDMTRKFQTMAKPARQTTWFRLQHLKKKKKAKGWKEMEGKPRGPKRYRNQYYDVTLFGYKHDFFF